MDRSIILFKMQKQPIKKDVLKNFTKFTGKHRCESLFFNKVAGLSPITLLKKVAQVFSCEFCKILKNIYLYRTPPDDCFWKCKFWEYSCCRKARAQLFNPFVPNAPFLYPLKTSENLTVEKGCIGNKWVKK